jgi:hypothetical protein
VTDPHDAQPTDAARPPSVREVEYKGAPLDAARGPGLGCFWSQVVALGVLIVLTPLSVFWGWPEAVSAVLLLVTLVLLLFAGQTVIFLLRLVAADRRADVRRAPMASRTPTVGQIEDEAAVAPPPGEERIGGDDPGRSDEPGRGPRSGDGGSGVPE